MEIKDFIEHFAEQFDDTELSEFTPGTVFHELEEYTSLTALSIIAMVDEEYGVTLNANDMSSAVTIKDLYNIINARL